MVVEEWLPIPGYPGYEASSIGRVRSVDRIITPRIGPPRRMKGRVLYQFIRWNGYRQVSLPVASRRQTRRVHALVAMAFHGPRPEGMEACHNDGNKEHNVPENIRWDTSTENMRDVVRHGHHHLANLTHCNRNHALVEPNLVRGLSRIGKRSCLSCANGRNQLRRNPNLDLQQFADEYYNKLMAAAMVDESGATDD